MRCHIIRQSELIRSARWGDGQSLRRINTDNKENSNAIRNSRTCNEQTK